MFHQWGAALPLMWPTQRRVLPNSRLIALCFSYCVNRQATVVMPHSTTQCVRGDFFFASSQASVPLAGLWETEVPVSTGDIQPLPCSRERGVCVGLDAHTCTAPLSLTFSLLAVNMMDVEGSTSRLFSQTWRQRSWINTQISHPLLSSTVVFLLTPIPSWLPLPNPPAHTQIT